MGLKITTQKKKRARKHMRDLESGDLFRRDNDKSVWMALEDASSEVCRPEKMVDLENGLVEDLKGSEQVELVEAELQVVE